MTISLNPAGRSRRLELAQRRQRVAELYIRNRYQHEIAAELGCSQSTISRDIDAIEQDWRESAVSDMECRKAKELAAIDEVQRELWAAWKRSQADHEVETTEDGLTQQGAFTKTTKKREDQVGDPAFMAGIQRCIEQRCKLLGLNAPDKHALTDPDGKAWSFVDILKHAAANDEAKAPPRPSAEA